MSRFKILHLIKSLGRGGAETLLHETLSLHEKHIFEFHYIYMLPWKDQMVKGLVKNGGIVTNFSATNNILLITKYSEVIEYCRDNKIDLVHCHLPWSGFVGRIVFRKIKIPVVYTEHNIQERYHPATKWLNKVSFNFQSIALGVSKDVTFSIENNIKPQIPVRTLFNGVNTEKFQRDAQKGLEIRKKFKIPADAIVVGNIAVFREQKRIQDWVKAFHKIHVKRPDIYGILVGAGPEEQRVMRLVQELGLEKQIIFPGLQEDTVPFFSAMDFFMMSSAFEGLPIALLEAMSMGCVVVSTKAGGVVEVVRNEQEGLLVEVGDWENLAEKVLNLVKDVPKRGLFSLNGRQRIEENFSLQRMVTELEKIYTRMITEKQYNRLERQ